MALSDFNINVTIGANTSQLENGLKKVQTQTTQMSSNFSKFTSGIKKSLLKGGAVGLAIAATTAAIKGLSDTIKKSIALWDQANSEQKKVAQTLKVTGAAAWTTTEELNAMADAYQSATNFSSNEITKMQTVLLGFKNITEDTFKSASDAILDMAEVMGMDLVSATQTVGKALDDPVHGMDSLSRQGFKFSDAEKELIKNLVEAGDAAKAQKIILDELNTTYGGAAREGAKASTQLKNNWNSLLQEMGRSITLSIDLGPALQKLNELLSKWKEFVKETADAQEMSKNIAAARDAYNKGTATDEQKITYLKYEADQVQMLINDYQEYIKVTTDPVQIAEYKKRIMMLSMEQGKYVQQVAAIQTKIDKEKKANEEAAKAQKKAQDLADVEAAIGALKQKYTKQIKAQVELWERTEKITGEATSLEEKREYYQKQLLAIMEESGGQITENNQYYKDQMEIINEITDKIKEQKKALADIAGWNDKLRQQEIDRISQADKEVVDYGAKRINLEKIFKLNTQQLEAQMQADLKGVEETENAEEAKAKIVEYYNNEKLSLTKDYNEQLADLTAQEEAEIWNQQQEQMQKYFKTALNYAEKVSGAFKKMASTIGNAIAGVFNKMVGLIKSVLQKVFTSDLNGLLDSLLKFEDSILTFFVETLPNLPAFFESALQSVGVLLESILQVITPERVTEIIMNIMSKITEYAPKIIEMISKTVLQLIEGITKALPEITKTISTIIEEIAKVLPQLIEGITKALPEIIKTMSTIVVEIAKALPKLIQSLITAFIEILKKPKEIADMVMALIKGFVEIFKVLMKNIGPLLDALLPVIGQLIVELVRAIPSILGTMASALGEAVVAIGKHIINLLIDVLNNLLKGLSNIWTWIPGAKGLPTIPHLATGTDNAKKGLTLVGEAGPELVNFRGGEQVLNNHNTQKALAGMGGNTNEFNVNFYNTKDTSAYALVSEFKQYNRQMAINGII